jgi:hypothetical protein
VTARSEDQSAYAAADLGQAPAASAHVSSLSKISADGTITTTAEATADQLGVNGAITISGFHVLAEARRGTDGKVKTRHDLSAGTVTVAGQSFGLSDGTFTLPGGAGAPVPADAVFSLMKSVGVRGAFQQATENKNGVVAPSLSLSYSVPATPGTKAVEVTVTLGRASAQLSATAAGDPATVVTVAPPPPAPGDGGTVPPTSGPAAPGTTPLGPSLGGSGSQGAPVGGPPAVIATTGPAQPTAAASRQPELHHLGNIYLAVVAAGLFTLGTATGVRLLGVRFT